MPRGTAADEWLRSPRDLTGTLALYHDLATHFGVSMPEVREAARMGTGRSNLAGRYLHHGEVVLARSAGWWTALHEFAHHLSVGDSHGPEYVLAMLNVVAYRLGSQVADRLRAEYMNLGVAMDPEAMRLRRMKAEERSWRASERAMERDGERGDVYLVRVDAYDRPDQYAWAHSDRRFYLGPACVWRTREAADEWARKAAYRGRTGVVVMKAPGRYDGYRRKWDMLGHVDPMTGEVKGWDSGTREHVTVSEIVATVIDHRPGTV
jgi:hypothetical protein